MAWAHGGRGRGLAGATAAGVLAVAVLVPLTPPAAAAPPKASTLRSGLQTGFQIDGNKTAASPPETFDWDDFLSTPQAGPSFTFTPTGAYTTAGGNASSGVYQGSFYWDNGTSGAACHGTEAEATGQSGSQNVNTNPWLPTSGKPNHKSNLCSGGFAVEAVTVAGQRHTILYGYWTRRTGGGSGSVFTNFEGHRPGRCDDLLLQVDYPGGATKFLTWTPNSGDNCANPLGAGAWRALDRTIDFAFKMGYRTEGPGVGNSQEETFGEYAIDLTAAGLFGEETCSAFTVATTFSSTGSGGNGTIQDFLLDPSDPLEITNCGTLTVTKQSTPPGSTDDAFGFTVSSDEGPVQLGPPHVDVIEGSLRPGQTATYENVRAGTATHLDEVDVPPPWVKQSIICTVHDTIGQRHDVNVRGSGTRFPVAAGGRTDCVITNNAALVTVTKQTEPDGSTQPFTFDVGGRAVQLRDGESRTIAFAADAAVTIAEAAVAGWLAPRISCTSAPTQTAERSVTVTAQLGQNIACTFTNTQLGTIIITTEAHGVDNRAFEYEGTFPGAEDNFSNLVVVGDGTLYNKTFTNIPPDSYSVTQLPDTQDPRTVLSDVSCTFGGADHSFAPEDRTGTFTVGPGETVRCFFTNSLTEQIFIIKRTLPVEFDQQFQFTLDGNEEEPFTLNGNSDGPPHGALWSSPQLDVGQHTVTELPQQHWTLDDISCNAPESVWDADLDAGKVTIQLDKGQTVTCFFTNRAVPAQATVTKTVNGVASGLRWGFDVAISPADGVSPDAAQRLSGAGPSSDTVTWTDLVPGEEYTISETRQSGWDTGPMTCTDPDDEELADRDDEPLSFTFEARAGQELACEMTNTGQPSSMQLTKITSGIGFDYPWQYDFTIAPVPAEETARKRVEGVGQTSDEITWQNLVPGQTYTLTEGDLDGVAATVTCGDGGPGSPIDPAFQFTAPLGGTLHCTATDLIQPVTATITKTSVGGDGTATFTLTPPAETGQDPQVIEITTEGGTGEGAFTDLVPGQQYSLTEGEDPAWQQSGLTCTVTPVDGDPTQIPDLTNFTVHTGDSVACAATNTLRTYSVAVTKVVHGVADDFEWSFQLGLTGQSGAAMTAAASGVGNTPVPVSWTDLAPGTYALSEAATAGWGAAEIVCRDGAEEADPAALVIGPGSAFTCTITNRVTPGQLRVTKSVDGVADGFPWAFDVRIGPVPGGEPEQARLTSTDPEHTWRATPGVVYTLTESVPAGWSGQIQCGEGSRGNAAAGYEVVVEPGATVACSIVNTAAAASGVLTKTTVGGDGSFDFLLRRPGGEPTTITVRTAGGRGTADLADILPGTGYSLVESQLDGWTSGELTCTATPPGGEPRELDVDNFAVRPGETLACAARNEAVAPQPPPTGPVGPTPSGPTPSGPTPSGPAPSGAAGATSVGPGGLPVAAPGSTMPVTGTDLSSLGGLALTLLLVGAALVGFSHARRRRDAGPEA